MKKKKNAFTLIELLVVIAIIGILAAMVMITLNLARKKGYNARVKSDVAQGVRYAEMLYNDTGSYATLNSGVDPGDGNCNIAVGVPAGIEKLHADVCKINGGYGTYEANGDASHYAIQAELLKTTSYTNNGIIGKMYAAVLVKNYYCIDNSSNTGKEGTEPLFGRKVCP